MLNCAEQGQIQKYKTHAFKTLKTAGVQTSMLKHPTKQFKKKGSEGRGGTGGKRRRTRRRNLSACFHRLVGLVVKASASRAEDPGFESRLRRDFFRGRVMPVTSTLALQWLPCQAPGVIGSALGLVGPVSVYCDWVRWKVGSATSVSVWLLVKLSEQIRP